MAEVELTSELMILSMAGLQDKKKSIDRFYAEYDSVFPDAGDVSARFRTTIDAITESSGDFLSESEFRRPPLFYTLYGALYHRMFGLEGVELPTEAPRRLTATDRASVDDALRHLSELIQSSKRDEEIPEVYERFVNACLRQTDNLRPRMVRLKTLYAHAFGT